MIFTLLFFLGVYLIMYNTHVLFPNTFQNQVLTIPKLVYTKVSDNIMGQYDYLFNNDSIAPANIKVSPIGNVPKTV
jgi:hypothetical protein